MQTFVINLDRAKERWSKIQKQLVNNNIFNSIRVDAIDVKNIPRSNLIMSSSNLCKLFCPDISIAISLSHVKAWSIADKLKKDKYLFCEDDVVFKDNFLNHLEFYVKELPQTWDILFVGCLFCQKNTVLANIFLNSRFKKNKLANENFSPNLKIPEFVFGSHAYLVSEQGLKKLIDNFTKIENAVDIQINNLIVEGKLSAFSLKNVLATQDVSVGSSSISSTFPRIASKLDSFYLEPQVTLRYGLSYPNVKVGNYEISGWTFIFFLYGFLSGLKLSFLKSLSILVILFIPDIIENDKAVVISLLSFLIGFAGGSALKLNKKKFT